MQDRIKLKKAAILMSILVVLTLFLFEFRSITAVSDNSLILGAHRGSSLDYTENTIEAFKAALEDPGYQFIEFDVQYTKDKKIVVFHDITLLRMKFRLEKVSDISYNSLNSGEEYLIPTYEEVMNIVGNNKDLNIEIKSNGNLDHDKEIVDFVVQDLKARKITKKIIISSVSKEVVKYVSENYPEYETGFIIWIHPVTYVPSKKIVRTFYEEVEKVGADYVMMHGTCVKNYELLTKLKPKNQTLVFWYFTDKMYIVENS